MRTLICRTHALIKRLEHRAAPNWKRLRFKIAGRNDNYHSGRAFCNGNGYEWDVFLTLPRPIKRDDVWFPHRNGQPNYYSARFFVKLVYHELMHTYGYNHSEYNGIRQDDLERIVPTTCELAAEPVKAKPKPEPKWKKSYAQAVAAEKRWLAKQKRAVNALKKARQKVKYYERKYC